MQQIKVTVIQGIMLSSAGHSIRRPFYTPLHVASFLDLQWEGLIEVHITRWDEVFFLIEDGKQISFARKQQCLKSIQNICLQKKKIEF